MIIEISYENGYISNESGVNIQYYGKDAEDFLENINWHNDIEYLGKECIIERNSKPGIIIGFEDNNSFSDYYYIIYCPEDEKVYYALANSREFIDSIKL